MEPPLQIERTEAGAEPEAANDETLCISCGYDLRSLAEDGDCPECGTPVKRSLAGSRLAHADPTWLRRLYLGQRALAWGWLLVLMLPATLIIMIIAMVIFKLPAYVETATAFIGTGAALLGLMLCAAGTLLVTMQDPRESLREPTWSPRLLARIGMIGAPLAYIIRLPFTGLISTFAEMARLALAGATLALLTIGIVSYLRMIGALLQRVPNAAQAKDANMLADFLRWGLPLALILQFAYNRQRGFLTVGAADNWIGILISLGGCFSALLSLVLIAKAVGFSVLLFQTTGILKQNLGVARVASAILSQ